MDERKHLETLDLIAAELDDLRANDDRVHTQLGHIQGMLSEILSQLAGYASDHERTAQRLAELERQVSAH